MNLLPDWDRSRRYPKAYMAMVADVKANCKSFKDDEAFAKKYRKSIHWVKHIRLGQRWNNENRPNAKIQRKPTQDQPSQSETSTSEGG